MPIIQSARPRIIHAARQQLAHGPNERVVATSIPRGREATLLEPLRQDAKSGPIPEENLRPAPILADEKEESAFENVVLHLLAHDGRERVERLTHVDGLAEREDSNRATDPDHPTLATIVQTSSSASPSIRKPRGVVITMSAPEIGAA